MITEYLGSGMSAPDYDLLALRIAPQHRQIELEAMSKRWWDYRQLHPAEATYLFAEHYRKSVVEWHKRCVDLESASDEARAFTPADIFKSRDLIPMWLARQSADLMGIPYETVMEFTLRRSLTRGFSRPMRPNQLYHEEFTLDLAARWDEVKGGRFAQIRHLRASQYRGTPLQIEYRAWLLQRLKANHSHRLLARLLHEDVIDMHMVREHFGEEMAERAAKYRSILANQTVSSD